VIDFFYVYIMEQKLYDYLQGLNIEYQKLEHEPFFTCEESEAFYQQSPGAHCKTLFVRNRKKTAYYLAVVMSDKRVDMKAVTKFLEEGQKMSFGSAEKMNEFLGLVPGSVTPFGLLHPGASNITKVLIDTGVQNHDFVHFHPLRNTATLRLSRADFFVFLDSLNHEVLSYAF
jgi:Ala-tRNA(Pro) deacylase